MSRLWTPPMELFVPSHDCGCGCGGAGDCGKKQVLRPRLFRRKRRCGDCCGGASSSSSGSSSSRSLVECGNCDYPLTFSATISGGCAALAGPIDVTGSGDCAWDGSYTTPDAGHGCDCNGNPINFTMSVNVSLSWNGFNWVCNVTIAVGGTTYVWRQGTKIPGSSCEAVGTINLTSTLTDLCSGSLSPTSVTFS